MMHMCLNNIYFVLKSFSLLFLFSLIISSCGSSVNKNQNETAVVETENKETKALLQGIWVDELTEDVVFRIEGDTLSYPDNTSIPVYFSVIGDSLVIGDSSNKYYIKKVSRHNFWFFDQSGDLLKLVKSSDETDSLEFSTMSYQPIIMGELVKRDTIVYYNDVRYRVYTTINPSKYKVYKNTFNDDGLMVQNVYYDNIINIAIFEGRNRLYSCDFNKNMFAQHMPSAVLKQCVFGNMNFIGVDAKGFKLRATIGMPDEAGAYVVDTIVYKF